MLKVEVEHDDRLGYRVNVICDKQVRNLGEVWVGSHVFVLDIVEEVLKDYRKE